MASARIVIFGWADSSHVVRWVEGLASRGYQIKLISVGGEPLPGIDCTVFPRHSSRDYIRFAVEGAREVRAFKPDLVHVHYASAFGLWGLLARRTPLIVSVWGSDIMEFPSHWPQRVYLRHVLKRATWITATAKALEAAAKKLHPLSERKLSVIPFGVEVPDICPAAQPRGPVRLCTVKWLEPVYGLPVLLHALSEVITQFPAITLSMAGTGRQETELRTMINALGLGEHVRLVGLIDNKSIYQFILDHDIMVMPSLQEGFGVAALEAAACGRPIVATNVGGIPEVVVDGVTGLLVPPNDPHALAGAILRLARDREERQQLGGAAYQFVKTRFTHDHALDMMSALYDRLIAEHRSRS